VNDPYDAANSTKDDERDLRVQGKAHVPNTMHSYSFDQSEADTILFSAYAVLRESVAPLSLMLVILTPMLQQQSFCSSCLVCSVSRGSRRVLCRCLVSEEMEDCIVQLHCITGCDTNSSFYGKVSRQ
jgi:hypothetical protein